MCLELHVSTQLLGIVQVVGIACHGSVESGRQRHFQVTELHVLHIAAERSRYLQWTVRPAVTDTLGHVGQEHHDIFLAYLCTEL